MNAEAMRSGRGRVFKTSSGVNVRCRLSNMGGRQGCGRRGEETLGFGYQTTKTILNYKGDGTRNDEISDGVLILFRTQLDKCFESDPTP